MMDYTDLIDPNNKRTVNLRSYVERIRLLTSEIGRLEAKRQSGSLNDADLFTLGRCFFEMGRITEAGQIMRPLVDRLADAPSLRSLSAILMEAHLDADAEKCLNKYLKLNPQGDANAWADLAKLQFRTGRKQAAQQSFIAGYRIDSQGLFDRLRKDQELYNLAAPLFQRRK